jgi:hypothetical protein
MTGVREGEEHSPRSAIARLRDDEGGSALLYFAILIPVIFGFIGLALEGAGFFTLNNQLQALADGSALAGAKQLADRRPGAICAARAAARTFLSNEPRWSWSVVSFAGVQIQEPQFYGPGIDDGPLAYSCVDATTTNDNDNLAAFIKVTTVTREVIPTFITAAFSATGTAATNQQTAATATAGSDTVVCDTPPMYICNPFETAGMTYDQATQALEDAVASAVTRGKMISMRRAPGNSTLTPGNFGFLNAPDTHGFNAVRDAIAKIHSPACFKQSGVDLQTGFAGNSIAPAFNVRFDIYQNSMSGNKTDPNYAPAKNVRKGYWLANGGNWCQADRCTGNSFCSKGTASTSDDRAQALPLDSNALTANPLGNGVWDFNGYWQTSHPGVTAPNGWSNANPPSRYQVYLYELAQGSNPGGVQDASCPTGASGACAGSTLPRPPPSFPQETGAPRCSTQTPPATVDRRLMTGAVINCMALAPLNGNNDGVPVAGFGKFFLISPVTGSGSDETINAEIVDLVTPDNCEGPSPPPSCGIVHRLVQLHR